MWIRLSISVRAVSIPRRYAKNAGLFCLLMFSMTVSIPRRYAKNRQCQRWVYWRWVVSIPRRYAKNMSECSHFFCFDLFQSLVGTLKTYLGESLWFVWKFQSLVGTLKTGNYYFDLFWHIQVSIPRRYAKNELLGKHLGMFTEFQSLVGTLKTRNWRKNHRWRNRFNPS